MKLEEVTYTLYAVNVSAFQLYVFPAQVRILSPLVVVILASILLSFNFLLTRNWPATGDILDRSQTLLRQVKPLLQYPVVVENRVVVIVTAVGAQANDLRNLGVSLQVPRASREDRAAGSADLDACSLPQGAAKRERLFIPHKHMQVKQIPRDKTRRPG